MRLLLSTIIATTIIALSSTTGLAKNNDNLSLPKPSDSSVPLDHITAVVNNDIITQSMLNQQVNLVKKQLAKSNTKLPSIDVLRQQVLQQFILTKLQLQLANRFDVKISNAELNNGVANIAKQQNMTVVQLKDSMQQEGITYAQFRKQIKEEMTIQRLQQQAIGQKSMPSSQQVAEQFQKYQSQNQDNTEYHIGDILIPLPDSPSPDQVETAKTLADKITADLKNGADFKEQAVAHSQNQEALKGGDIGWRKTAELPEIFTKPLISMDTNEVSQPIRAPNGFHILKLLGKRASKEKVTQDQIKQFIYQRNFNQNLQVWLQQMKNSAYIKIISS